MSNDINHAMSAVLPLLSKDSTDPKELQSVLAQLLSEDISLDTVVKFVIERRHEREAQDLPDSATVEDLKGFLAMVCDSSTHNRKRWEHRFKSGAAAFLCPACGFAGNGEAFKSPDGGNTICRRCGCFQDTRYFTRTWTPDEQAAYEAEQAKLRPLVAARDKREMERRERAVELEPKVDAVLNALDGVGDFVNEAEERQEIGPIVRAVVHASTLTADKIVTAWKQNAATHALIAQFTRLTVHEFAAGMILGETSMKEIIDNIDNYVPLDLNPLDAGEERFFFTRVEFVHEMTVNVARWQDLMDTRDLSTALGMDGKFAITVHAKGYAEAHPCLCADCKKARNQ